jgi:hypothetical protein
MHLYDVFTVSLLHTQDHTGHGLFKSAQSIVNLGLPPFDPKSYSLLNMGSLSWGDVPYHVLSSGISAANAAADESADQPTGLCWMIPWLLIMRQKSQKT